MKANPPTDAADIVPAQSQDLLTEMQISDHSIELNQCHNWLRTSGRDPENREGLATGTVSDNLSRISTVFRWVWTTDGSFTNRISHGEADDFVEALADDTIRKASGEPYAESSKRKMVNALQKYFLWRTYERGGEPWESPIEFSEGAVNHADEFTKEEREILRVAVLDYRLLKKYENLTPEERDRRKAELAQQIGKPKSSITMADWEREQKQCWLFPSLFRTSLDLGFRPVEIGEATVDWLRLDKREICIPKECSAKNRENWKCSITQNTAATLRHWLEQREQLPQYDDTDLLWLNREGNPFDSGPLKTHLLNVCELGGIDTQNRKLSWYSIRHSVGTHMVSEGNLAQAQVQLRHKTLESTLRYVHPSSEDIRSTLEQMG